MLRCKIYPQMPGLSAEVRRWISDSATCWGETGETVRAVGVTWTPSLPGHCRPARRCPPWAAGVPPPPSDRGRNIYSVQCQGVSVWLEGWHEHRYYCLPVLRELSLFLDMNRSRFKWGLWALKYFKTALFMILKNWWKFQVKAVVFLHD